MCTVASPVNGESEWFLKGHSEAVVRVSMLLSWNVRLPKYIQQQVLQMVALLGTFSYIFLCISMSFFVFFMTLLFLCSVAHINMSSLSFRFSVSFCVLFSFLHFHVFAGFLSSSYVFFWLFLCSVSHINMSSLSLSNFLSWEGWGTRCRWKFAKWLIACASSIIQQNYQASKNIKQKWDFSAHYLGKMGIIPMVYGNMRLPSLFHFDHFANVFYSLNHEISWSKFAFPGTW